MKEEERVLVVRLESIEGPYDGVPRAGDRMMEFHVSRRVRDELGLDTSLLRTTGNLIIPDFAATRSLARLINERMDAALLPERNVKAGRLNAMALIDEILHDMARLYREGPAPAAFSEALAAMEAEVGVAELGRLLHGFVREFPPLAVYRGEIDEGAWLDAAPGGVPNKLLAVEELLLLRLANENPAFGPYRFLFDDGTRPEGEAPLASSLAERPAYAAALGALEKCFGLLPKFGPENDDLVSLLREPMRASPYSLPGQLDYIRKHWGLILGERLLRLLGALDLIREEEKPFFPGPGPTRAYVYRGMEGEIERFSQDKDWMPNVVMMAKSTLVWLHQLSVAYGRDIRTLDAIPDEELDNLAMRGFNGLWLIGLWERSPASAEIKRRCGNPEAAASAYSLMDYEIAGELGGWGALERLRERASYRGIRLAADMVPNHTGIDSTWVRERPELFMSRSDCPFPGYSFNGPDLSGDGRVGIWLEDHYWDRSDAAVVFKRLDRGTGRVDYIYHGNDGTGLPWSDTAQIDFLKAAGREAVKERILHVAKNFPIIRFDAAMVLAKKHFHRLWYPEPGSGGDIASRSEYAMGGEAFDAALPVEFWREVVDLCAREAPDTLLLAEAFWMMEGYFVRSLGMHRVYNSAFMNMLKREENQKYRETIKNTQEFDKDILKRFVNFMNNPDEDTAVAQFGKGDKYFGVCTMMATMPGLPMFGHGQLEGFEEKYGMEYRRAYRDEVPDRDLLARHEREVFPLLKRRRLFSGVEDFLIYDLRRGDGSICDNVFAYSNGAGGERALVVFNNAYASAGGRISQSAPYAEKLPGGGKRMRTKSLAEALDLHCEDDRFLLLREERSGLWFLRRSREICESGLELILSGYECQVFLDLFEVKDDARGLYRAVHDSLAGRGVKDITEAIEDVALKDLYLSFSSLATRGLFEAARRAVAPGLTPALRRREMKTLKAAVSGPALDFYSGVICLLSEEATEGSAPEAERAAVARDRFLAGLDALAETAILGEGGGPGRAGTGGAKTRAATAAAGAAAPAAPTSAAAPQGAAFVLDCLRAPWMAEIGAAYAILDGLKALAGRTDSGEAARRIAERVFLERKLREALRAVDMPGDTAHRHLSLAAVFIGKSETLSAIHRDSGAGASALALLEAFTKDEEFRSRLGVNRFEGVEWFNKEHFEEALRFGVLAAALPAPIAPAATAPQAAPQAAPLAPALAALTASPKPNAPEPARTKPLAQRLEAAAATAALLAEAEAASGYRVADFRQAVILRAGNTPEPTEAAKTSRTSPKGKKA
jgi:hypothetical protein